MKEENFSRDFICPFCGQTKTIHFNFDELDAKKVIPLTLADIVSVVCMVKGVTHDEIKQTSIKTGKNSRKGVLVRARHLCYFFAYYCTTLSLDDIGGYVGDGQDHSTVLHGKNTITRLLGFSCYRDIRFDAELIRFKLMAAGFKIPDLEDMNDRYYRQPAFKYIYKAA